MSRKLALVTGGASGIGRASAIEFAQRGFAVIIVADLDPWGGEETCRIIKDGVNTAGLACTHAEHIACC